MSDIYSPTWVEAQKLKAENNLLMRRLVTAGEVCSTLEEAIKFKNAEIERLHAACEVYEQTYAASQRELEQTIENRDQIATHLNEYVEKLEASQREVEQLKKEKKENA